MDAVWWFSDFSALQLQADVEGKGWHISVLTGIGRLFVFFRPLSLYMDIPQSLWRMTSAVPDLRLPSQPQSTSTAPWPVFIPHPTEVGGWVGMRGWQRCIPDLFLKPGQDQNVRCQDHDQGWVGLGGWLHTVRVIIIIIIIINDNVYGAVLVTMVTARVYPVHLMNADWAPGGH